MHLTETDVRNRLKEVIDPELNIDIVSLGLIYDITVAEVQGAPQVSIVMTLTTPGCPLAGVFGPMIRGALEGLAGLTDLERQVAIELTFDPPWIPEMMSEEARAELADLI